MVPILIKQQSYTDTGDKVCFHKNAHFGEPYTLHKIMHKTCRCILNAFVSISPFYLELLSQDVSRLVHHALHALLEIISTIAAASNSHKTMRKTDF